MNTGAIVLGVIVLALIGLYIVLTVIDRRTPHPVPFLPFTPDDDSEADQLEMFMLAAIARGDAALAAYGKTGDIWALINGVLDMRNRLASGLDLEAAELKETTS